MSDGQAGYINRVFRLNFPPKNVRDFAPWYERQLIMRAALDRSMKITEPKHD